MNTYSLHCSCNSVELTLSGEPKVKAYCHCIDCRELLNSPFSPVTAWEEDNAAIVKGADSVTVYQHPTLRMRKYFCSNCGEVLFNTNCVDWRVVPQLLIAKNYDHQLPEELTATAHIFYEQRVVDISDELPKHMRGFSSPLFEG
ncbi:GFA family protein [Porticoccus sp.]